MHPSEEKTPGSNVFQPSQATKETTLDGTVNQTALMDRIQRQDEAMAIARRHRRSRNGQQALLDIGLAALIATGLGLTYLQITSQDQKTANAVSEGRRIALLSQASATFIKANQAAIQTTLTAGVLPTGCGGTAAASFLSVNPLTDAMPTNATSGGTIVCQTLASARLVPNGLPVTNGYGQTYTLLMALRTSPTGVKYVDSKLTTTGPVTPDDINGSIAETIGTAGGLFASNATLSNNNTQITGRTGAWQDTPANWNNLITPGHAVVNLAYALHSDVGEGLQRFADTATDHSGNKLNTSLYMSGVDNATGAGTNIYMNGTGANQPPVNAVLGASQVDTVTLTNQTPAANDPNVAASASVAPNTIDDTNPNTIRVNAAMNITAKNRFSVADGMHITATGATTRIDNNNPSATVVPAIIWDNQPNNANNAIGGYGLAYDLAATSNPGVANYNYTPTMWLTTYNPQAGNQTSASTSGNIPPVGQYAYGAMMSSVFWSAEDGYYFIAPSQAAATIAKPNSQSGGGSYVPNGASRLAGLDVFGIFHPVVPQYGNSAQLRHDPANTWNGGITTVGLYVDGNPYVDNGALWANNGGNQNTRVGAGDNQQWATYLDTEGNGYASNQLVIGLGFNGTHNVGYEIYNGVNATTDGQRQTVIKNGTVAPGAGNGYAISGYPCQPGYDGIYYANSIAMAANENGTLLACQYNTGGNWNWTRNTGHLRYTNYTLNDNVYNQALYLGFHMFCALSSTAALPPSYVAQQVNNEGGLPYSPYNVNYMATQLTQQVYVYPTGQYGTDTNGYLYWILQRAGTLDEYGGSAVCLD